MPTEQALTWYRGDQPPAITVTVTDADDDPIDLTGSTMACQVRARAGDTVLAELVVDEDDFVTGVARVVPTAEDSETVGARTSLAVYDVEWTDSQGVVRTLVYGTITVTQDVTRAAES